MSSLRLFYLPFPGTWQVVCDHCGLTMTFRSHELAAAAKLVPCPNTHQEVTK